MPKQRTYTVMKDHTNTGFIHYMGRKIRDKHLPVGEKVTVRQVSGKFKITTADGKEINISTY